MRNGEKLCSSSVLQDMDFGSFTKYQLFVNLIYNLQIPTTQASQEKYGDQAEHICFFNIRYYDPHGFGYNETPILVINMAYVERDTVCFISRKRRVSAASGITKQMLCSTLRSDTAVLSIQTQ